MDMDKRCIQMLDQNQVIQGIKEAFEEKPVYFEQCTHHESYGKVAGRTGRIDSEVTTRLPGPDLH
jgi:hypothetical protein